MANPPRFYLSFCFQKYLYLKNYFTVPVALAYDLLNSTIIDHFRDRDILFPSQSSTNPSLSSIRLTKRQILHAESERVFTWDPKWNLPKMKFGFTMKKDSVYISFHCVQNEMIFIFVLFFWSTIFVFMSYSNFGVVFK